MAWAVDGDVSLPVNTRKRARAQCMGANMLIPPDPESVSLQLSGDGSRVSVSGASFFNVYLDSKNLERDLLFYRGYAYIEYSDIGRVYYGQTMSYMLNLGGRLVCVHGWMNCHY